MKNRIFTGSAATATVLLFATLASPAPTGAVSTIDDRAARATLALTPGAGSYAGGSQLTLTGRLGVSGRRKVIVERHMGRAGDAWWVVPGAQAKTASDGSFAVSAPASAMVGLRYRVRAGKNATPPVPVNAVAQEVILTPPATGSLGKAMTFGIDTVGRAYPQHTDLPAITLPGRVVTLERQVDAYTWTQVGQTAVDAAGLGSIDVVPDSEGLAIYRAVAQPWTGNGDALGALNSFPVQVGVGVGVTIPKPNTTGGSADNAGANRASARSHSASRYRWGSSQKFDFDWEFGESLAEPSGKGSRAGGHWLAGTDGTGRIAPRNGGLLLSSDGYGNAWGQGVTGSTWATLQNQPLRYGRVELRGNTTLRPGSGKSYGVRYELVPTAQSAQRCGTPSIVLADFSTLSAPMRYGVRNASGQSWGGQVSYAKATTPNSYAVQITKKRITWFVNSRPIGWVKTAGALEAGSYTPRVSLIGDTETAMHSAKTSLDWVRGYSTKSGKKPTAKRSLASGNTSGAC